MTRTFASDNAAGIHPEVLRAIAEANTGHAVAYGADPWTERFESRIHQHFGKDTRAFLVFNGTAANVLSLQAGTRPFNTVLCGSVAHMEWSECGAPERFTGCKLTLVPGEHGKLTPAAIRARVSGVGDQHHVQPGMVSITQATEYGTIYTPAEIRAIADLAHSLGMYVHLDGARLANAAAALGVGLGALTTNAGVDVVSFGGTKNGLMCGEAIVFTNPALADRFEFIRKQGMQLASKMRFLAAQFEALLTGDLWMRNAAHSNRMARLLADELVGLARVQITHPVETNAIFARVPEAIIRPLQEKFYFHVWDEATSEVRWMCSFDTEEGDVKSFAESIRECVNKY